MPNPTNFETILIGGTYYFRQSEPRGNGAETTQTAVRISKAPPRNAVQHQQLLCQTTRKGGKISRAFQTNAVVPQLSTTSHSITSYSTTSHSTISHHIAWVPPFQRRVGTVDEEYTTNTSNSGDSHKPTRSRRSGSGCSTTSSTSSHNSSSSLASKSCRPNPRQRKNRKMSCRGANDEKENHEPNRKQSKSPQKRSISRTTELVAALRFREIVLTPPLTQYSMNMPEEELYIQLQQFIITESDYELMGYPMSYGVNDQATFYKHAFGEVKPVTNTIAFAQSTSFDVNAREFVPAVMVVSESDGSSDMMQDCASDSGHGSGMSMSPPQVDSDDELNATLVPDNVNNKNQQLKMFLSEKTKKNCVRCKGSFYLSDAGDYYSSEKCHYHWGKYGKAVKNGKITKLFSCCKRSISAEPCSFCEQHVWTGTVDGMNGPYPGFVSTKPSPEASSQGNYPVYALDCEMCYTDLGLELTKITLVTYDGQIGYEKLVKPSAHIVDYNTRFSGITAKLLESRTVKTLQEVQTDLLKIISAETILIGHALDNDLRALKIIHRNCVDTSVVFPHHLGFPYRQSLKTIMKSFLNRDIQIDDGGHSSFEDSRSCLELMLWRVQRP